GSALGPAGRRHRTPSPLTRARVRTDTAEPAHAPSTRVALRSRRRDAADARRSRRGPRNHTRARAPARVACIVGAPRGRTGSRVLPPGLARDNLHLAERRETAEAFELDLADA